MKIGIDLHVVDGKFQGSRTHVIELFSRVVLISRDIEFFFFLDKPKALLELSPAFGQKNVHLIRMPSSNAVKRLYWNLPKLAKLYALDAIHTQYTLPSTTNCKRLVTIHDILFETHPQYFNLLFVVRCKILIRLAAKKADHVFTVSEFSRNEISRIYGVPKDCITVILNGVAHDRFVVKTDFDDAVLQERGLTAGCYLLSVGRLEPRKNHRTLIQAYATLGSNRPPLVLVGQRDFRFNEIFRAIKQMELGQHVKVIEDVKDAELPVLYRNAKMFLYPSFAEGFGMPVIEAMAAGTPVITANSTALGEIAGTSGILIEDPSSVQELASAINKLNEDVRLRAQLQTSGSKRAKLFSWDRAAIDVRNCYLNL